MRNKESFEKQILDWFKYVIVLYWRQAILFSLLACVGTFAHHKLFPRFKAISVLHVKTAEDSSLQNVVGRASGMQWNPYAEDSVASKYVKVLMSENFHEFVVSQIIDRGAGDDQIKNLIENFAISTENGWPSDLASEVIGSSTFRANDDLIEIHSNSSTLNRVVSSSQFLMNQATQYIVSYERKEITDAEKYLKSEQAAIQKNIDKMNEEIEELNREHYFSTVGGVDTSLMIKAIEKLKEEEELTSFRLEETERNLNNYLKQLKDNSSDSPNRDISEAKTLADSYEALQSSRGRVPDRVRQLLDDRQTLKTRSEAVRARISKITKSLKPKTEQKISELKRKIEIENSFYQQLQKQIFENSIYQISIDNRVRPYSVANYTNAGRETSLVYKVILTGSITFLIFFFLLATWHKLFPRVTHRGDLQALGINFLGVVPNISPPINDVKSFFGFKSKQENSTKIHNPAIRSYVSTCFQILGTRLIHRILQLSNDRKGVISVLSQNSGDGKSMVLANLAVYFGNYGFKTLVVQADWLKPQDHKFFDDKTGEKEGLRDFLEGVVKDTKTIVHPTSFKNVFFMGSGLSHHSLTISSHGRCPELIEKLREDYDIILIDTPALDAGVEALEISAHADIAVVLARSHRTEIADVRDITESLGLKGIKNVYGILNYTPQTSQPGGYYHAYISSNNGAKSA